MVITASRSKLDFLTGKVFFENKFYMINEEMLICIDWYRDAHEWSWLGFIEEFCQWKTVITMSRSKLDFLMRKVFFEDKFYEINGETLIRIDWYRYTHEQSWLGFIKEFHQRKMVITTSRSEFDFLTGKVFFEGDFYRINEEIEICSDW